MIIILYILHLDFARFFCQLIIDMGLSTMIESKEKIQRKVVELVFHNVVKGGWKVTLTRRKTPIFDWFLQLKFSCK